MTNRTDIQGKFMAKFLSPTAARARSSMRINQAEHFACLIKDLEEKIHRLRLGPRDCGQIFQIVEYRRFIQGAYATGFVCEDFPAARINLTEMASHPAMLQDVGLYKLRQYVHTLVRAERWSCPHASVVLEALLGGSMGVVAERLMSDLRLRAT